MRMTSNLEKGQYGSLCPVFSECVEQVLHVFGQGGFEFHGFFGRGVLEFKGKGVECDPADNGLLDGGLAIG